MSERPDIEGVDEPPPSLLRILLTVTAILGAIGAGLYFEQSRSGVTSALLFLTILVGLVLAHEFGHFLTAKFFGVKVLEFGVGFPPRAFGRQFGETEYTVN